jgi:hypothetical protein
MKPTYGNFEAKKSGGYIELPPVGAYVAEIQDVRTGEQFDHTIIELMMEITEGEYKGRYHEVYEDQRERFGNATYRGVFKLTAPNDNDEDWRVSTFQGNLWCVQESNPGYKWDWDEKKLKGKKVGISVRKRLYTGQDKDGNPVDRETLEIGRFETVADVKAGKVKPMKVKDTRKNKSESTSGSDFTDVSKDVEVPFPTW